MNIMKHNFFCTIATIFVLILSSSIFGQSSEHDSHHHADSKYELGISVGITHLIHENENPFSAHIHLLRRLGSDTLSERISLGLGFEYIFSEHEHYSVVGTISINPIWALIFDISPGVLITEHEGTLEKQFVTHLEMTYEFDYNNFGIGPVIGYGFSQDDNHFMFGIHLGKGF
jgi:hypothetical protein